MEKYAFFPFAAKPWDKGQVLLTQTIKELNRSFWWDKRGTNYGTVGHV
jgi:hypothetical protein